MRRREFIGLVGGAAAWPLVAQGQSTKVPKIGVLVLGTPDPKLFMEVFREGLQKVGYTDGQNIKIEFRSANGVASRLAPAVAELVQLKVDILVVWQTPAAEAARQATKDIPIVMTQVGDPIAIGLVASLARPGGNITGVTGMATDLVGKSFELIREMLPSVGRVAVLANRTDAFSKPFLGQTNEVAAKLGIKINQVMMSPSETDDALFEKIQRVQSDAIFVQPSVLSQAIADLALKHRLPSFSMNKQLPLQGGLMSYSGIAADQWRDAALYVDKILKGSRPGDLPVSQPTKFELVINLKTAKALGIDVPLFLQQRADEVIE